MNSSRSRVLAYVVSYLELYSLTIALALAIISILSRDIVLVEVCFKIALLTWYLNIVKNFVLDNKVYTGRALTTLTLSTLVFYTARYTKELWVAVAVVAVYSTLVALTFNNLKPRFIRETALAVPMALISIESLGWVDSLGITSIALAAAIPIAIVNSLDLTRYMFSLYTKPLPIRSKQIRSVERIYRKLVNILMLLQKKVRLHIESSASIFRTLDTSLDSAAKCLKKVLYIATRIEMELENIINRLHNLLNVFEYIVEHSFLTMFIAITILLAVTVIFYLAPRI